jgi:hypothetical protein
MCLLLLFSLYYQKRRGEMHLNTSSLFDYQQVRIILWCHYLSGQARYLVSMTLSARLRSLHSKENGPHTFRI